MIHPDEQSGERARLAAAKKRAARRQAGTKALVRISIAILFVGAIYASGWFGVYVAKEKIVGNTPATAADTAKVSLGSAGNPVYLGQSPEILRQFFLEFNTPGERASADLSSLGIRRLNSRVEMTAMSEVADAIKVKVSSGPIAGTVYWIHHSQMPSTPSLDPIISPIPEG